MASTTSPGRGRGFLAVALTALLVASATVAGVSLVATGTASAASTQVTECTTIDEAGVYELANDITIDPESLDEWSPCMQITASDVTFDGNGYTIQTEPPSIRYVMIDGDGQLTNVTVRDVTFGGTGGSAMRGVDVSDSTVSNVDVTSEYMTPDTINLSGNNNTVAGATGDVSIELTGDDNRVVDSDVNGLEVAGLVVRGERNVVRNVSAIGFISLVLSGRDALVANSSFGGGFKSFPAAYLHDATGVTVVNNSFPGNNVVAADLKNITASTFAGNDFNDRSVTLESSDDNTLRDSSSLNLFVDAESEGNVIHGNSIEYVSIDGSSNLFYDNRFLGDVPQRGIGASTWNVSARAGTNVVGGSTVGGNYYATTDGVGFSEACGDADSDGICDHPNALNQYTTDSLPLADDANASVPYFEVDGFDTPAEVARGEATTVTATVTNVGTEAATQSVTVTSSEFGVTVEPSPATRTVTLAPGETTTVTFDVVVDGPVSDSSVSLSVSSANASLTTPIHIVEPVPSTYYQVDFVAGHPIETLSADRLYADQDRLLRFAFGTRDDGIVERDTAWPNETVRTAVDYGHIVEHDDGTASVTFTVADGERVTLSLAVYSLPGEEFSVETADQQELLNVTTETFGPGEHTITVDLPDSDEGDQADGSDG